MNIKNPVEISKYILDDSNISSLTIELCDITNIYPIFRIFGKRSTLTKFTLLIYMEKRLCSNLIILLMEKLKSNTSTMVMKIIGEDMPFIIKYDSEKKAICDFLINNNVLQHLTFNCSSDKRFFNSLTKNPQLNKYDIKYHPSSKLLIVKKKGCVLNGIKRAVVK